MWGRANRDKACVERFVAALNAHNVADMGAMLADDFCYIDSWREGVEGREKVLQALPALFAADPEFAIDLEEMTFRSPHVLMSGRISSVQFGDGRRAVWRVLCENGKLVSWQSWADGGPPPMSRALAPDVARDLSHRAADKPNLGRDA